MNSIATPIGKKRERIERKKNSVYSMKEQIELGYYNFLGVFSRHKIGILFMILLLSGATVIHSLSTKSILEIFFADTHPVILFGIAIAISIGLESLSVYLYSEHNDFLSHLISFVSVGMIVGVSMNEYVNNGQSIYSCFLRGFLGSVFLIGSLVIASNIRGIEDSKKRVIFEWLPRYKKRQIIRTIEGLSEESKTNYRDLCNTFKITQTSLRDLLVKHGKFHSKYFHQFPSRRNRRKSI